MATSTHTRIATQADTESIGQLLHDFNIEYGDPTPTPAKLSERFKFLLKRDDVAVVLGGDGPGGIAVLRFRPSIWSEGLECYLAELYVKPALRGHGIGRALMQASMQLARDKGADYMDVSTSEDDAVARKLYESCGFTNHESHPDGPTMYLYEIDL